MCNVDATIRAIDPCDIFIKENIAIGMSYFVVGFTASLMLTPLNVYLVQVLDASPAMQYTMVILYQVPWALKLIPGFLSDAFPIMGRHRIPYLLIGLFLYSFCFILYGLAGIDNIQLLSVCIFLATIGLIQMDVMADTLTVERSKYEKEDVRGQMQATCYSLRFGGGLIGALLGTLLSSHIQIHKAWHISLPSEAIPVETSMDVRQSFHTTALILGLSPLLLVAPWTYFLIEKYDSKSSSMKPQINYGSMEVGMEMTNTNHDTGDIRGDEEQSLLKTSRKNIINHNNDNNESIDSNPSVKEQIEQIWQTVQRPCVYTPLAFVYVYNILQVPNVAWQSFLQLGLEFPPFVLGITVTIGSGMTFVGILCFKFYFFDSSWRAIYIGSTVMTSLFSIMQMMLIFQINTKYLHISNYFFSVGDDVLQQFISGIQFLPVCILYMRLCPHGSEGASYAMLTTFGNIALVCANNVGNWLSHIWDVSNDAMRVHDYEGLWRLTVLTSLLALVPLLLLFLLPENKKEQEKLGESNERSKIGGAAFLVVLFGSITWSLTSAFLDVINA